MKVTISRKTNYFEADPSFKIRLCPLFRMLQEAALEHSERAGWGMKKMSERKSVWIITKFRMELIRPVTFGEELRVVTWSKTVDSLRAIREFEIYSGEEKVASASSVWVFLDLEQKKICMIPDHAASDYGTEDGNAIDFNLVRWKVSANFTPSKQCRISTRFSDFDTNGHINNTVYIDYAEHLVSLLPENPKIKTFSIHFSKEIPPGTQHIDAGFNGDANGGIFKIFSDESSFATGEMTFESARIN